MATTRDYGSKTGAGDDRPYDDPSSQGRSPPRPRGKSPSTPPDGHTEIGSEADIDDPSNT